jgi:hypothetical protein
MEAKFGEWDQADATMELWDQTLSEEEPETLNVPAVASNS